MRTMILPVCCLAIGCLEQTASRSADQSRCSFVRAAELPVPPVLLTAVESGRGFDVVPAPGSEPPTITWAVNPLRSPSAAPQSVVRGAAPDEPSPTIDPEAVTLLTHARRMWNRVRDFEAVIERRVPAQEPERLRLRLRERPYSVRLTWLEGVAAGRELVFVEGLNRGRIEVVTAVGDLWSGSAPRRMSLDPDGAMVKSRCSRDVRRMSLGEFITECEAAVQAKAQRVRLVSDSRIGDRVLEIADATENRSYPFRADGLPLGCIRRSASGRLLEELLVVEFHPRHLTDADFRIAEAGRGMAE